jgi:exodeoxyribonuclease VII small subunit
MNTNEPASAGTFEASLKRLESIVSELEADELDLEEALKRYEEGIRLANSCIQQLRTAELRVQELSLDDEPS